MTYDLRQPELSIGTENHPHRPILRPQQVLYLGCESVHEIHVHNASEVLAEYFWGVPIGQQETMSIKFNRRSGSVEPKRCRRLNLKLTPKAAGVLEAVVPCFVSGSEEPILLSVYCTARDVSFSVCWPLDSDAVQKVTWPPDNPAESLDKWSPENEVEENVIDPENHVHELLSVKEGDEVSYFFRTV